ncbi:MbtH-like protein|nr:MbtH-like protein [Candidatus Pantoea persica]
MQLNPFDDPQQDCHVLKNDRQQYSLRAACGLAARTWPSAAGGMPGLA